MKSTVFIFAFIANILAASVKTKTASFFDNVRKSPNKLRPSKRLIMTTVRLSATYRPLNHPRARLGRRNSRRRPVLQRLLLRRAQLDQPDPYTQHSPFQHRQRRYGPVGRRDAGVESAELEVSQSPAFSRAIATLSNSLSRHLGNLHHPQCPFLHRAINLLLLPGLRRNRPTGGPRVLHDPSDRDHSRRQDGHAEFGLYARGLAGGQYVHRGDLLERFRAVGECDVCYCAETAAGFDGD